MGAIAVGGSVDAIISILLGLALCLLRGLVLLAFGSLLVLDDEPTELQAWISLGALSAGLAVEQNAAILDLNHSLGILTLLAEHELVDEAIEMVLKFGGIVGAVDDPAVILWVFVGLGSQFKAEELDDIVWWASERVGDTLQVGNDGLDAVAFAFDFGLDFLHLVAIEGVGDIL